MELLQGFSDDDASQAADLRRSDRLSASSQAGDPRDCLADLIELWPEGRKIPYNPAGSAEMRNAAWAEWKDKLKTGKLPPRAAPPKP